MKALLFCQNPYAFGILGPLSSELTNRGDRVLWYVPSGISDKFPYTGKCEQTSSIKECLSFASDAIFVPGNEIPHYLRGVKVQIFHGFAGEKKGHFRIRHYFDLYLTQGPWFTSKFEELAHRYKDFSVMETGWSKLDPLFAEKERGSDLKSSTLARTGMKHLILYAPTFSPSLTSADIALADLIELSECDDIHVVVKFHDLTSAKILNKYKSVADRLPYFEISEDKNILGWLRAADLMISDTSSAVYEFLLLDKPVITIHSRSKHIKWEDISDPAYLINSVLDNLRNDPLRNERDWFVKNYHPYTDGKSSLRMIEAVEKYIEQQGIPEKRDLPLLRAGKMNRMFGKLKNNV